MPFREMIKTRLRNTLSLSRAVRLVWESSRGWTIASFVFMFIQGLLPLASLYMMKLMLDAVMAAFSTADKNAAFYHVTIVVLLAGAVTLLSNIANVLGALVTQVQGREVADYMTNVIHAKSVTVDLEYYENPRFYDTLHRAQQEAPFRPTMIVNSLAQVLQNAISLIGTGWLLLSFQWTLALLLIIAVLPSIVIRIYFSQKAHQLQRKYTAEDRQSYYFQHMLTAQEFAKEIRIFDLGASFIQRYQALRTLLRRIRLKYDVQRSVLEVAAQGFAVAAVFAAYLFVAYRAVQGTITLGDLVLFYQAFQRGQGFLQAFTSSLTTLYENNLYISNLYEFLDIQPKLKDPVNPEPIPSPIQTGIAFENISFQYPDSERIALEDVSISMAPGEVIALVGENGSGKTTLVKLLCRLYDPDEGKIAIDGIDIRNFKAKDLREEISIIFQDYAHYNLTARENIVFGSANRTPDEEEIIAAARRSDAHDVIMKLPRAYDTILGKLFENGEELSIGQWQKIALARAFLRDSQVIVLDEPTSAMDPKAEYEVFKKFRELLEGRSAILISHRLSTVRMADRVYVMEHGRIVESGTHDDLVSRNGQYANLFETQAQYYR